MYVIPNRAQYGQPVEIRNRWVIFRIEQPTFSNSFEGIRFSNTSVTLLLLLTLLLLWRILPVFILVDGFWTGGSGNQNEDDACWEIACNDCVIGHRQCGSICCRRCLGFSNQLQFLSESLQLLFLALLKSSSRSSSYSSPSPFL